MADWQNDPQNTTAHENVLKQLRDKDDFSLTMGQSGVVYTNLPVGFMSWDNAAKQLRRWNGSLQEAQKIGISGGGTGASDAATARANLGANNASNLTTGTIPEERISGTLSVSITGDAATLGGQSGSFYQNASNLNSGILPVDRLSGNYGIGITGSAAFLNGQNGDFYQNADNINAGTVPRDRLPQAFAGQYGVVYARSLTAGLNGNFTAGSVYIKRTGNLVTVTSSSGVVADGSTTTPQTGVGFIPSWAQPAAAVTNASYADSDGVLVTSVGSSGILSIRKERYSGSPDTPTSITQVGAINITYSV